MNSSTTIAMTKNNSWSRPPRRRRRSMLLAMLAMVAIIPQGDGFCTVGAAITPRPKRKTFVSVAQSTLEPCEPLVKRRSSRHRNKSRNSNTNNNNNTNVWRRRLGLLSRRQEEDLDYERRKQEWAARYTHIDSLRETFGSNRNTVWGDLDAPTARRLYKTLLPRSLLELYKVGVRPEDLAPLAYQARVAAKLYARERCQVPSRIAANLYDGLRQWKRYGKFQPKGMSYDQVWSKYESEIQQELSDYSKEGTNGDDLTEEDVTAQICFKILEKSCKTNEGIDRWILRKHEKQHAHAAVDYVSNSSLQNNDFDEIVQQLERDAKALLNPTRIQHKATTTTLSARRVFTLRLVAKAKRRFVERQQKTHNNAYHSDSDDSL